MPRAETHGTCSCGGKVHARGQCMTCYQAARRAAVRERQCGWARDGARRCTNSKESGKMFCNTHTIIWEALVERNAT